MGAGGAAQPCQAAAYIAHASESVAGEVCVTDGVDAEALLDPGTAGVDTVGVGAVGVDVGGTGRGVHAATAMPHANATTAAPVRTDRR
jgi:hypothetical protein